MCRRQPGIGKSHFATRRNALTSGYFIAIGRLCEKCDGKWYVNLIFKASRSSYIAFIVLFATRMSGQKPLFESVTNVTLELTVVAA